MSQLFDSYSDYSQENDIICALSTPPGRGGIAIIRVSGQGSLNLIQNFCNLKNKTVESHKSYFAKFRIFKSSEVIDEVLLNYFSEGKSFTGDETVEISCHGSPVIVDRILQELLSNGARLAKPGEFTSRAFFNSRIDLVQAESVLSLIESRSQAANRLAVRQLSGELSTEYKKILDSFLWVLAQIEAGIDFSTEGLDVVDDEKILIRLNQEVLRVQKLLSSYKMGRVFESGFKVALVGKPNVGKSSLLNFLAKKEVAIVTDEPGTTRDLVEVHLMIEGVEVLLVDTAGLRETNQKVEKIGIERSRQQFSSSDLILYLVNSQDGLDSEDKLNINSIDPDRLQLVYTKTDLVGSQSTDPGSMKISVQTGEGIDQLYKLLSSKIKILGNEEQILVSQARHFELLSKIQTSLSSAIKELQDYASHEFIAQELQIGVRSIHELLGEAFDEQVIDRIFKEFCLGK